MTTKAIDVAGPAAGIAMTRSYVEAIGRFAYIRGWPMVSMINRRTALTLPKRSRATLGSAGERSRRATGASLTSQQSAAAISTIDTSCGQRRPAVYLAMSFVSRLRETVPNSRDQRFRLPA